MKAKITYLQPKQSMREFFARDDVRDWQNTQKTFPPESLDHQEATRNIREAAEAIGAGEYFS